MSFFSPSLSLTLVLRHIYLLSICLPACLPKLSFLCLPEQRERSMHGKKEGEKLAETTTWNLTVCQISKSINKSMCTHSLADWLQACLGAATHIRSCKHACLLPCFLASCYHHNRVELHIPNSTLTWHVHLEATTTRLPFYVWLRHFQ